MTRNQENTFKKVLIFRNLLIKKANSRLCNHCLGKLSLEKDMRHYKCRKNGCRKRVPVSYKKLWFNKHIPVEKLIKCIDYLVRWQYTSFIAEELHITEKTIRKIRGNLLNVMIELKQDTSLMIGGENVIVEIDESKFGKRKYNRGRCVEGVWVIGMVERTESRRLVLVPVKRRDGLTLLQLVRDYVHPSSIIYSDKWKGYTGLTENGYRHQTVNHSYHYVDPVTGVHTNTIEGTWSAIKAKIPARYRTKSLINFYLYLFMMERSYGSKILEEIINFM